MENKVSKSTIIRTTILFISLTNMLLAVFDKSPLPISEEMVTLLVSTVATIAAALWAWWKNNSFTKAAIQADNVMAEIKDGATIHYITKDIDTNN